jgi:hypothetical protein
VKFIDTNIIAVLEEASFVLIYQIIVIGLSSTSKDVLSLHLIIYVNFF